MTQRPSGVLLIFQFILPITAKRAIRRQLAVISFETRGFSRAGFRRQNESARVSVVPASARAPPPVVAVNANQKLRVGLLVFTRLECRKSCATRGAFSLARPRH